MFILSTGALWRVQFCNYERDHPGDGLHQEGEARNKTSSPISPTEVDEGTRSSPGTTMGEGRQNPPMHVQGRPEWVRARETTPRSLPPSKPEGVWRTKKRRRPWKRQRSVERDLTRPSPCLARRMRIQLKAHTRQTWSQIERRADADIDIINLSRRILSPSLLLYCKYWAGGYRSYRNLSVSNKNAF